MLCYCVLHVLRHFVQWNCCIEEMRSMLQLLEFEGCLARKLRLQRCDLNVIGFERNIAFFRLNGASVAEKSWLPCATVAGVVALVSIPVRSCARSGTDGSR